MNYIKAIQFVFAYWNQKHPRPFLTCDCNIRMLAEPFATDREIIKPPFDDIKEHGQLESRTLWKRFYGKIFVVTFLCI